MKDGFLARRQLGKGKGFLFQPRLFHLKGRVGKAVSKRIKGRAAFVDVIPAFRIIPVDRSPAGRCVIVQRQLADAAGKRHGQMTAGVPIPKQELRSRHSCFTACVTGIENCVKQGNRISQGNGTAEAEQPYHLFPKPPGPKRQRRLILGQRNIRQTVELSRSPGRFAQGQNDRIRLLHDGGHIAQKRAAFGEELQLRGNSPDAFFDGDDAVRTAVRRPGPHQGVAVLSHAAGQHHSSLFGKRKKVPVIFQKHHRLSGNSARQCSVLYPVYVHCFSDRLPEKPGLHLRLQNPFHRTVDFFHGDSARHYLRFQMPGEALIRHIHIHSGLQGEPGAIGPVFRHALSFQLFDAAPIADHKAIETQLFPQHLRQKAAASRYRLSRQLIKGGHHGTGACPDCRTESRKILVLQRIITDFRMMIVAASLAGAVADEMLGAGQQPSLLRGTAALKAAHCAGCITASQQRILARPFDHSAPAGIAAQIQHGRKGPAHARVSRLRRQNGIAFLNQPVVKRSGHHQRNRENRLKAVNHIAPQQQRDF